VVHNPRAHARACVRSNVSARCVSVMAQPDCMTMTTALRALVAPAARQRNHVFTRHRRAATGFATHDPCTETDLGCSEARRSRQCPSPLACARACECVCVCVWGGEVVCALTCGVAAATEASHARLRPRGHLLTCSSTCWRSLACSLPYLPRSSAAGP
jgi:hypothetical protein